jgi:hypothetical protein
MSSGKYSGFSFRRMTIGTADVMMTFWIAVGALSLFRAGFAPAGTLTPSATPWIEGLALVAGVVLLGWLLASRSRFDRRCAEDYTYQLLSTGAMVGMFAMLIANIPWALDFIQDAIGLRDLRGDDMLAIGLLGWGVGYFTFRVRGLR